MTGTASSRAVTDGEISSHGESHTSMSRDKSQGMSRVDPSDASPQVRKSRTPEGKSHAPLPREVTFSALSLRRAERDPRGGGDQQNPPPGGEPEPVGPLAEQFLNRLAAQPDDPDLAARRRLALDRLRRTTRPKEQKP